MIVAGTLSRYFGRRFLLTTLTVFGSILLLIILIDFIELARKADDARNISTLTLAQISLYRVPQIAERILPFCILIATMSCYLSLSRGLELVVARAAGMSAWQFLAPAVILALLIGAFATTVYNPVSATLHERAKHLEADAFGRNSPALQDSGAFWLRQRGDDGQSIIGAANTRNQGMSLSGVTVFTFDAENRFKDRIEAREAELEPGAWRLSEARIYSLSAPVRVEASYSLSTTLTAAQVRESLSTPETVPFWQLPAYIESARSAGVSSAGYRQQYYKLLAQPFLLAAMVLLAAAVSLRFFRFGGVQRMVLSGVVAGFLLYVLSKVTEDLSRAEVMHPATAAWLPVLVGGFTGLLALLHQEDG